MLIYILQRAGPKKPYNQGWDKDQRALQMVSYLDEKAMNVAQELSDRELYDYDALVGLLSARFDPASRVSASRSRFHGRTRRHQEDADTYADSITELCRLGYPQSSPELRQELIGEQFVRGQSDPELKKYLWVVIRTQKDKKLQTLIEVCTPWWTVSSGAHRGRRNHLCHRSCNRCSLLRVAWATRWDRSRDASMLLDRRWVLDRPRIRIIALHSDHVIIPGLSVSAVVSWDTPKFVAPNRTHLSHSGQVDGWTGRMDPSEIVEDPHRETKYRPGPNPHWPVCHWFGPRFIIFCHPICSSGQFNYPHIRWGFILWFSHRTFNSATNQGGWYSDQRHQRRRYRTNLYTDQKRVNSYRLPAGGGRRGTVFSSREGGTDGNRSFAGRTADRPVVRIRGSITLRGSCYAYLRNGTLVFGGLDRRSFGRILGGLGVFSDSDVRHF